MRIIFVVITPFHYLLAYVMGTILKEDKEIELILILIDEPLKKYKGKKSIWDRQIFFDSHYREGNRFNRMSKNMMHFSFVKSEIRKIAKKNKSDFIFYFNDSDPISSLIITELTKKSSSVKRILIEEGLAPYAQSTVKSLGFVTKINYWLIGRKYIPFIGAESNIKPHCALVTNKKYIKNGYAQRALFLEFPKNKLPNRLINSFLELNNVVLTTDYKAKMEKSYLYLSQPFSEIGLMSFEKETEFLKKVFDAIKTAEIECVVKLHHRESQEKREFFKRNGIPLLELGGDLPVESISSLISFKGILTATSSGAINYSLKNNGRVIWLENLLLLKSNSLKTLINSIDKSNFYKVKDENDLIALLNNIKEFEGMDNSNISRVESELEMDEWTEFVKEVLVLNNG